MIDVSDITEALRLQLENHVEIHDEFRIVDRGEYPNYDPANTPWCGIYRPMMDFSPRTLGQGANNWMALVTIKVVVQAYAETGRKAETKLDDLVRRVLTAILFDRTFGGKADKINSWRVEYSYSEDQPDTFNFQWAFITLIAEVHTS